MRAVLDTNVVISALLWRGEPYRLLDTIRQRPDIRLFTSARLIEELVEVLARPMAGKRLALIDATAAQVLIDYAMAVELVVPHDTPRVVAADPDDDHVIAAAVAARADFIITGDRHLLGLERHQEIRILAPADAARIIRATQE